MEALDIDLLKEEYNRVEKQRQKAAETKITDFAKDVLDAVKSKAKSGDQFKYSKAVPNNDEKFAADVVACLAEYNCPAISRWNHAFLCDCESNEPCKLWINVEPFWAEESVVI